MKWLSVLVVLVMSPGLMAQDNATVNASVEPDGHFYYVTPIEDVEYVDPIFAHDGVPMGTLADVTIGLNVWGAVGLRVWVAGEGEAFAAPSRDVRFARGAPRLAIRVSEPRDVEGRLFVESEDGEDAVAVDFMVSADGFTAEARGAWLDVVADNADVRLFERDAGAAWYRSQLDHARTVRGQVGVDLDPNGRLLARSPALELEETFQLFSGSRALSENLALDRLLPFGADADSTVAIQDIRGVTVADYDWSSFVEGLTPEHDPLASIIPADQHVVFFPSFDALVDTVDALDTFVASLGRQWEQRSQSAATLARYERQLCLPLDGFARMVGSHLVNGIALTGGDPYFRVGTDVALVFEPIDATLAFEAIKARAAAAAADEGVTELLQGTVGGVVYTGHRNAARTVSSYVAEVGGNVVVTNSLTQLERIASAASGHVSVLTELDEYTFFRDRYKRGDANESALMILSDATIRRWCGPAVRIGSSRRARAGAVLSEVAARALDGRITSPDAAHDIATPDDLPATGVLALDNERVNSDVYGSLSFATPISELALQHVTLEESELYGRWRRNYESGWRSFDPIAVRFGAGSERLAVDVTVRPLMTNSDYETWIDMTSGGAIKPTAGDRHPEAFAHFAMAVSPKRLALMPEAAMANMMVPGVDIYSWMAGSFSVYFDDDEFWTELAEAESAIDFAMDRSDYPIAVQAEVASGLKLTAFLAGLRGLAESTAPGLTVWQNREHAGQPYVRVADANDSGPSGFGVFYATVGGSFTISLDEDLIRRAIDRALARETLSDDDGPLPALPKSQEWFGEHVAVSVDLPNVFAKTSVLQDAARFQQRVSWSNLAILNEWHRRFPDSDPVDVHERWFARRLICPGGGEYRWNDTWKTMESTIFGHPGAPLNGPAVPAVLDRVGRASFGVTFEDDGLRARGELELLDP